MVISRGILVTLKTVVLITAAVSQFLSLACERKHPQPASPIYERVVRAALPHDLSPRDSVACIGAHNEKGELYDLGCNVAQEQDPMVGMYKATFSENPDADPRTFGSTGNVAGSAWRCHFAPTEAKLICERLKN